ncbi:ABC transporter permease [Roseateles paludis]|jgi:putative ABC transport system permease protein|uniref:FtsX-like permease family protein n=1 Tax=Roseateles paludis TaxID=3145238 RepID=A0ABV0G2P7_9BURK
MSSSLTLAPATPSRRGFVSALHALLLDLRPILSTLRRHRIAAGLIVLEVALSFAIVTNALHLIQTRIEALQADSGMLEPGMAVLEVRYSKALPREREAAVAAEDMARLRALPGIRAATTANQIAYAYNSNNNGVRLQPGPKAERLMVVSQYGGDDHLLATFGLQLVEGRNFLPEEVLDGNAVFSADEPRIGQVILSKAAADKLFPGRSALGQSIYVFGDVPSVVIGVVQKLTHPFVGRGRNDGGPNGNEDFSMILPLRGLAFYVVRADPAQLDTQIKAAAAALEAVDPGRVVTRAQPLHEMRAGFYAQDRAMAWLMGGVCVSLLLVTAMGIVGLASFWVQQRTRMIGTRRALGATEGQIRRYFQVENLLLTTTGVVIGIVGAVALSQLLMQSYEVPRLPWAYLPAGAVALWLLGQVAVWVPAQRAARLSPVAALRS